MSKRSLSWLIAILASFALVAAACGSDSDSDGDTDDTSADDTSADADVDADVDADADADSDDGAVAAGEGSIWVLLPDTATSDRWEKDDRRFFKEGFEAAGLSEGADFSIVNAEGDAAGQISQAEQAIGDGASVIVLTSNDSGSGATIIDLAREAGVAVVEYAWRSPWRRTRARPRTSRRTPVRRSSTPTPVRPGSTTTPVASAMSGRSRPSGRAS